MAKGRKGHQGLYRRGRVYWTCIKELDGKTKWESTRTTDHDEAVKVLTTRRNEVLEGRDSSPKLKRKNITLKELSTEYLAFCQRQKSYRGKKPVVERLVKDLGHLPLARFSTRLVEQYQGRLLHEGKQSLKDPVGGKKPSTVNRYVTCLRHMFTKAVDWQYVHDGALREVRKAKNLKEMNRRTRVLSVAEGDALVKASSASLRPIVIALLHTLQRVGEVLAWEWDKNIDLRRGFVTLEGADTKSGEPRVIPITWTLRRVLAQLERHEVSPFVFHKKDGSRYGSIKKSFHTACTKAGVKNLTIHDLRRTGATYLVKKGVPVATVSAILGHADLKTTLRYLSMEDEEHLVRSMAVLDGVFDGSGPEKTEVSNAHLTVQLTIGQNKPLQLACGSDDRSGLGYREEAEKALPA